MQIGFAKVDITPRVGVDLCGFGAFLNRQSVGVRDRLWARAMVMRQGGVTLVLISCDLIGVPAAMTRRVREMIRAKLDVPDSAIMVNATHTHSGPATGQLIGWGDPDPPYLELLPEKIARAGLLAAGNLAEGSLRHAAVPCEGVALNREYDKDAPPLEEVLRDDWRPAKPELTDTLCHVVTAEAGGKFIGFFSYFGCHPVVCCQTTRFIHGDFVGVATNMIEREHPGSVGLFLQGAMGDVNSCVVHKPEAEALLALDVIAGRYACSVRAGIREGKRMDAPRLWAAQQFATFKPVAMTAEELRGKIAQEESILHAAGASDGDQNLRLAMVRVTAYRRVQKQLENGGSAPEPVEFHAFAIGPVTLLGTPFEVFQAIKNDVAAKAQSKVPLLLSMSNHCAGYAVDKTIAARGGYAAQMVPLMLGTLPLGDIHDDLVHTVLRLEGAVLQGDELGKVS